MALVSDAARQSALADRPPVEGEPAIPAGRDHQTTMTDFEVSRTAGQCGACGRVFTEGEEFTSVVFEAKEGFERRDVCPACWQGPPAEAVCFFKTHLAKKEKAKKTFVDDEVLVDFFLRLSDAEEPHKQRFRFVLSLILLRKRLVKYERTVREDLREFWEMRLMRDKSLHRVYNPALADAEIEELTRELKAILQGDVPEEAEDGEARYGGNAECGRRSVGRVRFDAE